MFRHLRIPAPKYSFGCRFAAGAIPGELPATFRPAVAYASSSDSERSVGKIQTHLRAVSAAERFKVPFSLSPAPQPCHCRQQKNRCATHLWTASWEVQ
jgi:hypothetical protein